MQLKIVIGDIRVKAPIQPRALGSILAVWHGYGLFITFSSRRRAALSDPLHSNFDFWGLKVL